MAMSRGGWGEFVDGGSPIARHKRMVLDQGSAIGTGVIGVGMRVLLLRLLLMVVLLLLLLMVVLLVVRVRGALTRDELKGIALEFGACGT